MFLRTGDVRCADVMERVLYNGALSGLAIAGDRFFYTNVLESKAGRRRSPYFGTACCPSNISRLLGTIPGYVYATRGDTLFVNLFVASEASFKLDGKPLRIVQKTDYPWSGSVRIEIDPGRERELELRIRVPGWARGEVVPSDLYTFADANTERPSIRLDGTAEEIPVVDGYATVRRTFRAGDSIRIELPMPARRVKANPRVEANTGREALQRGPLVFAFEAIDNGGTARYLSIDERSKITATFREDILGGVVALSASGSRGGKPAKITAIPYFAWANRGAGEMMVWLPVSPVRGGR